MRKNIVSSFIEKTWEILQDQENSHILRWSQDGFSFQILNEDLLSSQILPKYFKHSNFSSFIRQLNMYNFHKAKSYDGTIEFSHQLFRKNDRELLIGIRRKPSEAEMLMGEELIKKLGKASYEVAGNKRTHPDENVNSNNLGENQPFLKEITLTSHFYQNYEYNMFPMMANYINNFHQMMRWPFQPNQSIIKQTIILKKPPSQLTDIQNIID